MPRRSDKMKIVTVAVLHIVNSMAIPVLAS